jgi:hypothetical protein
MNKSKTIDNGIAGFLFSRLLCWLSHKLFHLTLNFARFGVRVKTHRLTYNIH